MKGKAGAMDRRSSARWTVLALCAFSFGLGMLFTDRCFSLSPAVGSWKLWISPGGGGGWLAGRWIENREIFKALIAFEIWKSE
jgi:hypothetical protein